MKLFTFLLLFALPFFSFAQDVADNTALPNNPTTNVNATHANANPTATPTVRPMTATDLESQVGHLAVGRLQFMTLDICATEDNNARPMPYIPVTRKEYLLAAKVELAAKKVAIAAAVKTKVTVRPAAVQEAEKKAMIEQLKAVYTGVALEVRMRQYLKNYRTDEQYLQDHIDFEAEGVDSAMHLMTDLLAQMSPAGLGKPAIVSVPAVDFNGFEDGHTDRMLVRMNPAYSKDGSTK
jgi:hypothetical protein